MYQPYHLFNQTWFAYSQTPPKSFEFLQILFDDINVLKIQHWIQRMGSFCRISISLEHRGSRWRVYSWNVFWKHCYQHFRCLFDCFNVHRTDTFALPKVSLSSSTDHYGDHPPQRHTWQIRLMFCEWAILNFANNV